MGDELTRAKHSKTIVLLASCVLSPAIVMVTNIVFTFKFASADDALPSICKIEAVPTFAGAFYITMLGSFMPALIVLSVITPVLPILLYVQLRSGSGRGPGNGLGNLNTMHCRGKPPRHTNTDCYFRSLAWCCTGSSGICTDIRLEGFFPVLHHEKAFILRLVGITRYRSFERHCYRQYFI